MHTNTPRIFISHAWEEKALARRLELELKKAGAHVWVDHSGIRGGDNLPERISDALEWCNTLLLIWSAAASSSRWVKIEWTNAISLERIVIPCLLDNTRLPGILANRAYLDFKDVEKGVAQLLHALNLARQPMAQTPTNQVEEVAYLLHTQLIDGSQPRKAKPSQTVLRSTWIRSVLVVFFLIGLVAILSLFIRDELLNKTKKLSNIDSLSTAKQVEVKTDTILRVPELSNNMTDLNKQRIAKNRDLGKENETKPPQTLPLPTGHIEHSTPKEDSSQGELRKGEKGWTGLRLEQVDPSASRLLFSINGVVLRVVAVEPLSPAAKVGIRVDDLVTDLHHPNVNQPLSIEAFESWEEEINIGKSGSFTILRREARKDTSMLLMVNNSK